MRLSVIIITLNEAENIARCIRSVKPVADEVIVLDSYSIDNTKELAEQEGATVYLKAFDGYGEQKLAATALATNNWILNLDADEELSTELQQSILNIKKDNNDNASAYKIKRLTNYCGRWIRHSGWYPERVIRLWNKEKASFTGDKVHEGVKVSDDHSTIETLEGDLLHYSFPTISSHLRKIEVYSEAGARFDYSKGKQCGLLKLIIAPKWQFIVIFLLKKGFLDGYYGYLIARNSAFASFAKYQKLRELYKTESAR